MTEFQAEWIEPKWRKKWQGAVARNFLMFGICAGLGSTAYLEHRKAAAKKPEDTITMQTVSGTISAGATGPIVFVDDRAEFRSRNAAPPVDHPPASIKVGAVHYKIRFRRPKDMPGALGTTFTTGEDVILLRNNLSRDRLREVMLHELIHACAAVAARLDQTDMINDDQFIERVAPNLLSVMRDNPELVRWLQAK